MAGLAIITAQTSSIILQSLGLIVINTIMEQNNDDLYEEIAANATLGSISGGIIGLITPEVIARISGLSPEAAASVVFRFTEHGLYTAIPAMLAGGMLAITHKEFALQKNTSCLIKTLTQPKCRAIGSVLHNITNSPYRDYLHHEQVVVLDTAEKLFSEGAVPDICTLRSLSELLIPQLERECILVTENANVFL